MLMNHAVFGKTMENLRKHRYIKLLTSHNRKKKELFSITNKLSYYKVFPIYLLAVEMEKSEILMNKAVYL